MGRDGDPVAVASGTDLMNRALLHSYLKDLTLSDPQH
ncbi:MAG: hypothetical protein QOH71_4289 [Blastocatellia bacterium]|jgi:hypothetical protein|nr:hypothetical protein [Blastocatellia bacterium]